MHIANYRHETIQLSQVVMFLLVSLSLVTGDCKLDMYSLFLCMSRVKFLCMSILNSFMARACCYVCVKSVIYLKMSIKISPIPSYMKSMFFRSICDFTIVR